MVPTSRLPPIATITTSTTTELLHALQYLHALYLPPVRASRRRPIDNDIQADAFERAYAIRWLTALIAQLHDVPTTDAERLTHQAASLLATCAGVAAAGKIQRRFTFESTLAGEIHVALTDIPLDNHDYASVGAQTWGGACVLAEMIAEHPGRFGLKPPRCSTDGPCPLRVLELGAGTGLVGLTVAKLLQAPALHRRATVVLTDFYPAVLDNLQSNIDANFPTISDDADHAILVNSHHLDWSSFSTTAPKSDVLSIPFDVIFGADIIYEAHHAVWIRDCLEQSLLPPSDGSNEDSVFHLVIPLRPTHTFESGTVEEVFGSKGRFPQPELIVLSKESIVCEAYGDGKSDDVEYVYYQIGWTR